MSKENVIMRTPQHRLDLNQSYTMVVMELVEFCSVSQRLERAFGVLATAIGPPTPLVASKAIRDGRVPNNINVRLHDASIVGSATIIK